VFSYVVRKWMCLCFILLHVDVLCVFFGKVTLSDRCSAGDCPCILVRIRRYCHICCFFFSFGCRRFCMVLIVLKAILMPVPLNILAVYCVSCPKNVNVIHLLCWYFLWCDLGSLQFRFCLIFYVWICLYGIDSVVLYCIFSIFLWGFSMRYMLILLIRYLMAAICVVWGGLMYRVLLYVSSLVYGTFVYCRNGYFLSSVLCIGNWLYCFVLYLP
jgi:hypothetical protein